ALDHAPALVVGQPMRLPSNPENRDPPNPAPEYRLHQPRQPRLIQFPHRPETASPECEKSPPTQFPSAASPKRVSRPRSSAGYAGAILQLGGGIGRGAEPPSELRADLAGDPVPLRNLLQHLLVLGARGHPDRAARVEAAAGGRLDRARDVAFQQDALALDR